MIEIRVATTADTDALLPMIRGLFGDESIAWDESRTRAALVRLLADASIGRVTIAHDGAAACGYAIVTWGFDLEFGGRDAFLTELWVEPAHRGSGLGTRLLGVVETAAREAGAGAIHLQVRPENPAQRLYRRAGFDASPRLFLSRTLGE
jgi:ribosomal protein S18 acetylase RimI-like enzyme